MADTPQPQIGGQGAKPLAPPQPPPQQGKPLTLQSSIRTMSDDIAGRAGAPSNIPTPAPSAPPAPPKPPMAPPIAPAPRIPAPNISHRPMPKPVGSPPPLFGGDKSSMGPPSKPVGVPPMPASGITPPLPRPKPGITPPLIGAPIGGIKPPKPNSGSKATIIITAVLLIAIIAVLVWFFVIRDSEPKSTPTPIPTATPTPTPISLNDLLSPINILIIPAETDAISGITQATDENPPLPGDLAVYYLVDSDDQSQNRYTFSHFADKMLLNPPSEISTAVNDTEFYYTLFGNSDGTISRGFIVGLTNMSLANNGIRQWETTLADDIRDLFLLDPSQAISQEFINMNHRGTDVRYNNYSTPLKSIDHATVTLSSNGSYLIVTNSRDHMFSILDNLGGEVLGK
ncbi:MAG: hypothetical protein ABH833_04145 [Parcubacteria group bacterium]